MSNDGFRLSLDLTPEFSTKLICRIAKFCSFKTRAKLVCCGKSLYKAINPSLYRDIDLWDRIQMSKLCSDEKVMNRLEDTWSMTIHESILWRKGSGVYTLKDEEASDHLPLILQAAMNLRHLILTGNEGSTFNLSSRIRDLCSNELHAQIAKPMFLPNLVAIQDSAGWRDWREFCYERPVVYHSAFVAKCLDLNVHPFLDPQLLGLAADTPISPLAVSRFTSLPDEQRHTPSAGEIGCYIKVITDACPGSPLESLVVHMHFGQEVVHKQSLPIGITFSWIRAMILAADCIHLTELNLHFKPTPLWQSAGAQRAALVKLEQILPALQLATISYPSIVWGRKLLDSSKISPRHPNFSGWTPRPNNMHAEALRWWLSATELDISNLDEDELRREALKLRKIMCKRWHRNIVPLKGELYEKLLGLKQSV